MMPRIRRLGAVSASAFVLMFAACGGDSAGPGTTDEPALVFASVSAGNHTCGVTTDGEAYCWGSGPKGELGNGSTDTVLVPVPVLGGLTFQSVSAGGSHTCGVTTMSAAYCWGLESSLGIGLSDTVTHSTPEAVVGGLAFQSVSAAGDYNCGVTTTGAAYCWGRNNLGQLGIGSFDETRPAPEPVLGALTFQSVSANAQHTCGLTICGAAYCWGSNEQGQLGVTTTETCQGTPCSTTPVVVSGGLTFASVSAGDFHTCGVTTGSDAYCWGSNGSGQLGDGTTTDKTTPTLVAGGLTFASVSAADITCGVTTGGAAYCWGNGYLGNGPFSSSTSPVAVAGGLAFVSVSTGGAHTCGITTGDVAYCWGHNWDGTLGSGSMADSNTPIRVFGQP